MGRLYISKSELRSGVVDAPPSKAFTLRYLLASALSRGWVKLLGPNWGDDSWAMVRGVKPISEVEITTGSIRLRRSAVIEEYRVIDVGESGFTMRTLAAVYSGIRGLTLLVPRGSLRNRPMGELINALRGIGCGVEDIGGTLRIRGGRVGGGEVEISGSVSSQFISALLYLSPLTDGGIEVIVKPPIKSKPYIDSTVSVLREYGIRIEEMNNGLYIPGGQEFKPSSSEVRIPGDYGLSSYYIALAAVLGIDLEIRGLERSRAVEGEYDFVKLVSRMGVALEEEDDSLRVRGSSTVLNALDTDLSHAPDIVMPLALVMAKAPGRSRITGIEHLAYKESNRLLGTARILKCLGARVRVEEESGLLEVEGVEEWVGGCTVDAMGDHRLIMMGVIAGLSSRNPVEILDWEPVTKSWPTFLLELENMGALISYSQ